MLTDIFSDRYKDRVIWPEYGEREQRLLVQCFRIVSEQLIPYWINGKESEASMAKWSSIHDRLSMELGVHELAPKYYSYQTNWMGKPHTQTGTWNLDKVCKDFVCAPHPGGSDPDSFIKDRISFIELAFRLREEEIQAANASLSERIAKAQLRSKLSRPNVSNSR